MLLQGITPCNHHWKEGHTQRSAKQIAGGHVCQVELGVQVEERRWKTNPWRKFPPRQCDEAVDPGARYWAQASSGCHEAHEKIPENTDSSFKALKKEYSSTVQFQQDLKHVMDFKELPVGTSGTLTKSSFDLLMGKVTCFDVQLRSAVKTQGNPKLKNTFMFSFLVWNPHHSTYLTTLYISPHHPTYLTTLHISQHHSTYLTTLHISQHHSTYLTTLHISQNYSTSLNNPQQPSQYSAFPQPVCIEWLQHCSMFWQLHCSTLNIPQHHNLR